MIRVTIGSEVDDVSLDALICAANVGAWHEIGTNNKFNSMEKNS